MVNSILTQEGFSDKSEKLSARLTISIGLVVRPTRRVLAVLDKRLRAEPSDPRTLAGCGLAVGVASPRWLE